MKLSKATIEDYESIIAFYDDVTDRTPEMELYARWQKGKHPTHDGIRAYIEEGSMYLYKENDAIVGAMAVTMYQGEDYHAIEWSQQVLDNEAAVIHILAVSPDCQGKGIGSEMIREAIRLAQTNGMKAIRLDALASNTPAHKIYKALGFEYRGQQHLYAENTGWTDFYFFEYINHTIYERNNCYMKHEIIELHDVQIIGMAKKIAFNEAKEECPKFWGEYVEKIIKPVVFEKQAPNTFQQVAFANGVGEFGLCTCDIPNHNCATCWEANFGACCKNTFTYVIGGIYKGGDIPEGMQLFPIQSGKWLKIHFEGGMKAFQEQYTKFHKEWLPAHPEYKWAQNSCSMEWYHGTDIQSPDYQCGVMMPLEAQPRFKFNTVGLFTNDNKATVEFYTKTFGFTTSWDGVQPNVEMFLGDNRIILFPRDAFEQMVSKKFQYPEGFNGTMELSLDVSTFADVDKEYQNALNYGAKSVLPPTTEPWGQRTCYVADPDGNLIEIGSFVE